MQHGWTQEDGLCQSPRQEVKQGACEFFQGQPCSCLLSLWAQCHGSQASALGTANGDTLGHLVSSWYHVLKSWVRFQLGESFGLESQCSSQWDNGGWVDTERNREWGAPTQGPSCAAQVGKVGYTPTAC